MNDRFLRAVRFLRVITVVLVFLGLAAAWIFGQLHPDWQEGIATYALYLTIIAVVYAFCISLKDESSAPPPSRIKDIAIGVAAVVVLLCIALRGFFVPGIPILRHDWQWPLDVSQFHAYLSVIVADWSPQALGTPKGYPTLYVLVVIWNALATVFGGKAALLVSVVAALGLGSFGIIALGTQNDARKTVPAVIGAAFYVLSPFVLNKFVAGHIPNIIAFGLAPFLLWICAKVESERTAWIGWGVVGGLVVALATAQVQYLPFFGILLVITIVTSNARVRIMQFSAVCLALGIAAQAQSLWHLVHPLATLERPSPSSFEWLSDLSVVPSQVFSFDGYVQNYITRSFPGVSQVLFDSIASLATCVFVVSSIVTDNRLARRASLITCAGLIGATGELGPFEMLKQWVLAHVIAFNIFREFYNFEALVALGVALSVPAFVVLAERKGGRVAALAIACVLAVPLVLPTLGGGFSKLLFQWNVPPAYDHMTALLPSGSRIAMLPLIAPLRYDDVDTDGSDPFFLPWHGHPTVFEGVPRIPISTAAMLFDEGKIDGAARLLGVASVAAFVLRDGFTSDLPDRTYPWMFSETWKTNWYYRELRNSPKYGRLVESPGVLTVLRNPFYVPPLALGALPVRCERTELLHFLSRHTCSPPDAPSGDVIHFPSAIRYYNPRLGWTPIDNLYFVKQRFSLAPGFATAGIQQLPLSVRYVKSVRRIAVHCFSFGGLGLAVNGARAQSLPCSRNENAEPKWTYVTPVHPLTVTALEVESFKLGLSVVDAVVVNPQHPFTYIDPVFMSYALPSGMRDSIISENALSSTLYEAKYRASVSRALMFSSTFDPRWKLSVDGSTWQSPVELNSFENGFILPPGSHSIVLRFDPGSFDRTLGIVQYVVYGTLLVLVVFLSAVAGWRRLHA